MNSLIEMKRHRISLPKGPAEGIALFILGFCFYAPANAQFLLVENFSVSPAASISVSGWTEQCGGAASGILATDGGLTHSIAGFAGSGVGNAAEFFGLDGTAQKIFSGQSLPVYISFLINVQSATGGTGSIPCGQGIRNIINFLNNGGGTTNERNGLVIQSSGEGFKFGVDGSSIVYTSGTYNYNQTYLLVLKARPGGVDLYINPTLGASEPLADIQTSWIGSTPSTIQGVNISESGFGNFLLDAIKVSPGWSNVTALQEPTAQPTNLTFTNVLPNAVDVSFDDAVSTYGTPSYLVIRSTGSYSTDLPVDGTSYAVGNAIGTGTVVHAGGNSFQDSGLDPATAYYYSVYSFYSDDPSYDYYTTTPLQLSVTTPWNEPTIQTSNLVISARDASSASFNVTAGNGTHQMIVVRKSSAVEILPVDGTVYTGTYVYGTGTEIGTGNFVLGVGGPDWGWGVSPLEPETEYVIRSFALNDNAVDNHTTSLGNFLTTGATGNPVSFTTLALSPTVQASSVSFTILGDNSLTLDFTGGDGATTWVVARQDAAVDSAPTDGVTYTPNSIFGNGSEIGSGNFVVGAGPGPVTVSGLTPGTTYHFALYESNGSAGNENYLTTGTDNTASRSTLLAEPTLQTSNLVVSQRGTVTVSFNSTAGNGSHEMIVFKSGAPVDAVPVDGTVYSGTYSYGDGSELGTGNFVVAVVQPGTSTWTIGSLQPETQYFIRSFALNDNTPVNSTSNLSNFLTTEASGNPLSFYTLASDPTFQPDNLTFTNVSHNSFTANFSLSSDFPDGYLALMSANIAPDFVPVDGEEYALNEIVGVVGGNNIYAVFSGSGSTFNLESLSAEETLYFKIYAFNGSGETINYHAGEPLSGSQITLAAPPTLQASALNFTNVTTTSLTLSFTDGDGASRIVVARESDATASDPADGVAYSANAQFGLGALTGTGNYVVAQGSGPHTITGLTPGTSYTFQVYELNGSGPTTNYLQTTPLAGSQLMIFTEPSVQASGITVTGFDESSVTLTFTNGDGSNRLLLAKQGSAVDADPMDGVSYNQDANFGVGSEIGTGNFVVGSGSGPVTVTGLGEGPYHFRLYEFNGSGGAENYNPATASANPVVTRNTWHVSTTGNDSNDGSSTLPLRNIQTALDIGFPGDMIRVEGGIYAENLVSAGVDLRGGYDNTFSDLNRDILLNQTVLKPSSGTVIADNGGSIIDGMVIDGRGGATKGILVAAGHSIITHNVVFGFLASGGTGIQVASGASAVVRNNSVASNHLTGGGVTFYGIYIQGNLNNADVIENNIVSDNDYGIRISPTGVQANYNCVFGSKYGDYDGAATAGSGDVNIDPLLVRPDIGDLRLKGTSPCIDAGNPADDFSAEPLPNGGRINIGTYGGTENATTTGFNPVTYVSGSSGSNSNDGSIGAPYQTIQYALNNALGEVIKVEGGEYEEALVTRSKVTLMGGYASGFDDAERDILSNKTFIYGVSAVMYYDAFASTIDGFILDGRDVPGDAGIKVEFGSVVTHNIVKQVSKSFAAGIESAGGAQVVNNTVIKCSYGIEIKSGTGAPSVRNNILAYNNWGMVTNAFTESVRPYNDIFASSFQYSGANTTPGEGDLSLNPQFRDTASATLDLRLGISSPCIDAGNPSDNFADEPDPNGARINMGAYGGTVKATSATSEPTTPSSSLTFTNITGSSMTVNFTPGDGASRILVSRSGSPVSSPPTDGTSYTASASFGSGDEIGTGNYAVAVFSDAAPVAVTGLDPGTTYHFHMYEFNGGVGSENYLTGSATGNPASATTLSSITEPSTPSSSLAFSNITTSSITVDFTPGDGSFRMLVCREGSGVDADPTDGMTYLPNASFGSGDEIGSGNFVVGIRDNDDPLTVTGLNPGTIYHFRMYEFHGTAGSEDYLTVTAAGNPNSVATSTPTPIIESFTPTEGPPGTEITIAGQNLSGADLVVSFNGIAATVLSASDTEIVVVVPETATDGSISVEVNGEIVSSSTTFDVTPATQPAPVINDFTPAEGAVATPVTINGINFGADPIVKFNNMEAVVDAASTDTQIITAVPAGATSGYLTVRAGTVTAVSTTPFTVISAPTISSFAPARAAVGDEITISGLDFDPVATGNTVAFNGVAVTEIVSASAESLVVLVPAGATKGKIAVTVNGRSGMSSTDFVVVPRIVSNDFVSTYDRGTSITVSFTVDNAANVKSAVLKIRGISGPPSAEEEIGVTPAGNTYEVTVPATQLTDPVGVEYSAAIVDQADVVISGNRTKAFLRYPSGSAEQALPGLSFGNQVSNYQIIAVPLNLGSPGVTSVFSALGEYNRKLWRLFDYSNGTREYPAFSTIVPGKGYWLIVRNATTINPGEGTTVQVNSNDVFEISLVTGWNLIGNPFNFSVSWPEILTFNDNPEGVGALKGFAGGVLSEIDVLPRYRGGFVFSASAVTLQIPALRNTTLGGRIGGDIDVNSPLDSDHWQVPLFLSDGNLGNALGGIGMHPEASVMGKDRFDEVSVPLPEGLDLFEMRFPHPEFPAFFNREVVPPTAEYTWQFEIKGSSGVGKLKMTWKNDFFGNNEKALVLFDPASLETVDMRQATSYVLSPNSQKLQILYGSAEYIRTSLEDQLPWLGKPYPNPATEAVTIPFRVPKGRSHLPVTIIIYNSSGMEVARPVDGILNEGPHEVTWQGDEGSGLFLLRMQLGEESKTVKLLFH